MILRLLSYVVAALAIAYSAAPLAQTPQVSVSPSAPSSTAPVLINVNTAEICYPTGLGDGVTVTVTGTSIDVLLLATCPFVVGVPPPPFAFVHNLGLLAPGTYTVQYRRSFRTGSGPYAPAVVMATLTFAVAADSAIPTMSDAALCVLVCLVAFIGGLRMRALTRRSTGRAGTWLLSGERRWRRAG